MGWIIALICFIIVIEIQLIILLRRIEKIEKHLEVEDWLQIIEYKITNDKPMKVLRGK